MNASHPLSAMFGFVIAGILALTTSQASPPPATLNPASIRIEYMPHPRDMVQIKSGSPYVVPSGKIFVLTALGSMMGQSSTTLKVNGILEEVAWGPINGDMLVRTAPAGLTAPAGASIEIEDASGQTTGRAWGYLAPQ